MTARLGRRLRPGDRVRLVAPAGPPHRDRVELGCRLLSSWGLVPEVAAHAHDTFGDYLAGRDADRLADINAAFGDPAVRAVLALRGGQGSYRLASGLDLEAVRADPKPLVGFSDIVFLHLALHRGCGLATLHGPAAAWDPDRCGPAAEESLRRALMDPGPVTLSSDPTDAGSALTTTGVGCGPLLGGYLRAVSQSVGWGPSYDGAILAIEAVDLSSGEIDGALTQLRESGALGRCAGVAVGQFVRSAEPATGRWSWVDVLADRLAGIGVPVLGGLPIGHGPDPPTIPLGTQAVLDADSGTLTVDPAVR